MKIKKIFAMILALLMLVSSVPTYIISALAAPQPVAYGTFVDAVQYKEYTTAPSPDEHGWNSYPRKMYFAPVTHASGYTDINGSNPSGAVAYNQAYCINHGGKLSDVYIDKTKYVAYRPQDSAYFKSLNETQQMGMLLVSAFGYPSIRWSELGVNNEVAAITATQALLWEFDLGNRTSFSGMPDGMDTSDNEWINAWAYEMVSKVEGGTTAYWNILAKIRKWLDNGGDWKKLLSDQYMLIWENGDIGQVIITYAGTKPIDPRGSISVIKSEVNGNKLSGAMFTIYDSTGKIFGTMGPTDANGYAQYKSGKDYPEVPYGTYRIVETKFPANYEPVGPTAWTITVNENSPHITLNATNRPLKYVEVQKETTGSSTLIDGKVFAIYDYATGEQLITLQTDANGNTDVAELPQTKSGVYRWEEITDGPYSCLMWNGSEWVDNSEPWLFRYDDIAVGGTLVLKAKNDEVKGFATVKKTTTDGSNLENFYFEITKPDEPSFKLTGKTNSSGYLVTESCVGIAHLTTTYTLGEVDVFKDIFGTSWSTEYGDVELSTYFCASQNILLSDFFAEIKAWRTGTYGIIMSYNLDSANPTHEIIMDNASNLDTMELSNCFDNSYAALVQQVNNEWVLVGEIFNLAEFKLHNGGQNIITNIQDMMSAWKDLGYGDRVEVNAYTDYMMQNQKISCDSFTSYFFSSIEFDANYDGYIDEEDIAIYQRAVDAGLNDRDNVLIELDAGEYLLTEMLSESQQFYAEPYPKSFVVLPNQITSVLFENTPAEASLRIVKYSEDGIVAGFKFRVEGVLENGKTFYGEYVTGDDGTIFVVEDDNGQAVIAGTYTITELDVPARYEQPEPQVITITADEARENTTKVVPTFRNTLKDVPVYIKKTSEDGIVEGFYFKIAGITDSGRWMNITVGPTDSTGMITANIAPGRYWVHEIMPEDGRYVTQKNQRIEPYIDDNGVVQNNTVSFHNVLKKFTLKLTKVDGLTGKVEGDGTLEGAVYGLYKDGVLVEQQTTDAEGKLSFATRVMEIGYTIQEISPSEGYYLDTNVYDIDTNPANYDEENIILDKVVSEQPVYGTISIYKLKGSEESYVPESGAVFQIWLKSAGSYANAADTQRDTITTSVADTSGAGTDGGSATTKELPHGTYVVHQVSGDERFALIEDFEVEITAEHINECYTRRNDVMPKEITLFKKEANKEVYLSGAGLKVVNESGVAVSGTTDSEGKLVFMLAPDETYTVWEEFAPEGYAINTVPVTFTLDIYGNVSEGTTTVENEPNRYVVKKVDANGNTLANATFAMISAETGETFKEITTGADGLATFEYIPWGKYLVKEISAPDGYKLSKEEIEVEITNTWKNLPVGEINSTYVNEDIVVVLEKIDAVTLHGIAGAEITVKDANGSVYIKTFTDADGKLTLNNIPAGKYQFFESYAPEGYEINTTVFDITIDEYGNIDGNTTITDKNNEYIVKKTDKDGKPLANATFEMKTVATDEVFATVTTGADGLAVFKSIPYGTYEIRETKAPAGYKLSDKVITVTIDGTWQNLPVGEVNDTVINEPTEVIIDKTKFTDAEGIPNAEITIYNENGEVAANGKTNENGQFIVYNLPAGKYTFKETYAPEGFELNTTVFEFEIKEDGTFVGDNTVTDKPNKYVIKKVDEEGNTLEGATFEMKNVATSEVFTTITTGSDGLAVFMSIPYGTYEIRETKAPDGHKLSNKVFAITVDGTWTNAEDEIDDVFVNSDTEVIINKTDADTGAGIPGATITVYDANGNVYVEGQTDAEGKFIIKNILVGKYTFRETAAPELYELNDTVFEFEVTAEGEVIGDTTVSDKHNEYVVKKTDKDGKPLAGATFEMKNVATDEVFATVTTGEDGLAVFKNIPFGKYVVYETKAPAGYKLSDEILEVEITSDWKNLPEGEVNGNVVNEPTVVIFSKTEITTADKIPGATITVYDSNGKVYAEGKTDKNGEFVIYNIVPGKYTFKETYAPSGFEINTTVFAFEITEEGDVLGGTNITDKPNKYVVKKTDKDGNALAGAIFEMKNTETGEVFATVMSDENGIALFASIPYGIYEIREVKAPEGYKLSDKVLELTVDGEYMNLGEGEFNDVFVNEDTEVTFNKTDASDGAAVPGAEITVYDENGEIYAQGITDENGQFTIYNIVPGKYTFKETYAPNGYKLNTTVFEFEITAEGAVIGSTDITNEPIEVVITKTDLTGEKTISGAEITIYDEDGNVVFEDVTDESGIISVTYLAPGTYTFKETAAANGWAINTSTFTFTIDAEGNVSGDDTITDDLTRVKIYKVNEKNEPLAGVVFNAYDKNGNLVTSVTTDENGIAVFEGLRWNEYTFKEVSTLEGYYLASDSIKIVIDDQWDNASGSASATVVNYPIPQPGDTTNLWLHVILALVSAVIVFALTKRRLLSV